MTAEILVMNKNAVALAADSASTMFYQDGRKTYNTANKLFTLSKYHPVGLMIFGGADLNGVPWETLVKMGRRQLGQTKYSCLTEYAEHFIRFVESHPDLASTHEQSMHVFSVAAAHFSEIRDEINAEVKKRLYEGDDSDGNDGDGVSEEEIAEITACAVRSHHERLLNEDYLDGWDEPFVAEILDEHSETIDKAREEVFESLVMPDEAVSQLREITGAAVGKRMHTSLCSGIVIAGFGEGEIFPSYVEYEIEGLLHGRLKYTLGQQGAVTDTTVGVIVPLAQSEMVAGFMDGIAPDVAQVVDGCISVIAEQYPQALLERLDFLDDTQRETLSSEFQELGSRVCSDLRQRLEEQKERWHWGPVMTAVGVLPKDELAALAESLVNLTSLRRRMSTDSETVGGPVDVAVISKGDGFIWIKRKHYFRPELNQHFFANYFLSDEVRRQPTGGDDYAK